MECNKETKFKLSQTTSELLEMRYKLAELCFKLKEVISAGTETECETYTDILKAAGPLRDIIEREIQGEIYLLIDGAAETHKANQEAIII